MAKRVLVTGGAGFIGSHCVDAFVAHGEAVTVLDIQRREDAKNLENAFGKITYIEGDIQDRALMERLAREHSHILHLAAIVSVPLSINKPLETHDTNVTGTLVVFDAAQKGGVKRVVYASSAAVYGNAASVPISEDAPLRPLSPYGLHKLTNETYAKMHTELFGLETVGLRFFNVYGSRQDPHSPYSGVVSIFSEKLKHREPPVVYGDGTATRDFVHVFDVAKACWLALDGAKAPGEVFNVGSGERTSINELLRVLSDVLGTDALRDERESRPGEIQHSHASIEKIRSTLGYNPQYDLERGLSEMLR